MAVADAKEHDASRDLRWEKALVVACARHAFDGSVASEIRELSGRVNWSHAIWLARRHRMLLPLANAANSVVSAECPAPLRAQLASYRTGGVVDRLRRTRKLYRLHAAIGSAADELEMTATSALVLSECYFGGKALRDIDDIPRYLVPATTRERARALLEAHGHTDHPLQLSGDDFGRVRLETGERRGAVGWPMFDPHAVFARSVQFEIGTVRFRVAAPSDWLVALATRIASAQSLPLADALDLLVLGGRLSDLDWHDALATAIACGAEAQFLIGVAASCVLFEHDLPPSIAARFVQDPLLGDRAMSVAGRPSLATTNRSLERLAATEQRLAAHGIGARALGAFTPTSMPIVECMLRIARTTPDDVVYDLGCGDGRVVLCAAARFGARGVGVDLNEDLIARAGRNRAALEPELAQRVRFINADVFDVDLCDATVVCLYMEPFALHRIRRDIVPTLRPGTRIVGHNVSFPDWPPDAIEIMSVHGRPRFIQLWTVPDPGPSRREGVA